MSIQSLPVTQPVQPAPQPGAAEGSVLRRPVLQLFGVLGGSFGFAIAAGFAIGNRWLPQSSQALAVPLLQLCPLLVSWLIWLASGRQPTLARLWALRGTDPGTSRPIGSLLLVTAIVPAIGVAQAGLAWTMGVPVQLEASLLGTLALVPAAALVLSLTCFGEEVVWRGHLMAIFAPLPPWRRVVVTSLIWAAWQVPVALGQLAAGQLSGREALAGVLTLGCAGMVLGWLRIGSGVVWPAVWGHALLASALVGLGSASAGSLAGVSDIQFWTHQGVGLVLWLVASGLLAMRHQERSLS